MKKKISIAVILILCAAGFARFDYIIGGRPCQQAGGPAEERFRQKIRADGRPKNILGGLVQCAVKGTPAGGKS